MADFTACAEPGCDQIAEETQRFVIPDSEGRGIQHVTTACLFGHHLTQIEEPEDV